ncbi:MAG: GntR family transcriptional regulator, partial [Opitutaceae bacterium]
MPPASLVDEDSLIAELKIGLTPVRQALRRLALENLVVILARRGTIVADVNASDLRKIYELRVELVPYAFRLAARRATALQLAALDAHLAESGDAIACGDVAQLLAVDRKSQRLVIEATQNEFLMEILERLHNQAMRFWRADHIDDASLRKQVAQHRRISAAVKQGNGKLAATLIRTLITT